MGKSLGNYLWTAILGLLMLIALSPLPAAQAQSSNPDFSNVNDILLGRRLLLPADDFAVAWADPPADGIRIYDLLTHVGQNGATIPIAPPQLLHQNPTNPNTLQSAVGRMFNLPNDVIVTVTGNLFIINDPGTGQTNTGTIPYVGGFTVQAATMADLNGDGLEEIALGYDNGMLIVGGPTDPNAFGSAMYFGPPAQSGGWSSLTAGDFDGDGTSEIASSSTLNCDSPPTAQISIWSVDATSLEPSRSKGPITVPLGKAASCDSVRRVNQVWVVKLVAGQYKPMLATSQIPAPDQLALFYTLNGAVDDAYSFVTSIDADLNVKDMDFRLGGNIPSAIPVVFEYAASGRLAWFGYADPQTTEQTNAEQLVVAGVAASFAWIGVLSFDADLNITAEGFHGDPCCAGGDAVMMGLAIGNFEGPTAFLGTSGPPVIPANPQLQIAIFVNSYTGSLIPFGNPVVKFFSPGNAAEFDFTLSLVAAQNLGQPQSTGTPVAAFVAGDLQGRSMRLGPPDVVRINGHTQPDVILGAPPMHVDFITTAGAASTNPVVLNMSAVPGDGTDGFFSQYDTQKTEENQSSTQSTTSQSFAYKESVEGSVSLGVPFINDVSASVAAAAMQTHDKTVSKSFNTYQGTGFDASTATGWGDQIWYKTNRFNVYVYPVIGHTACPDGETCPPSTKQPLHVMFSGPDMITLSELTASTLEWYQPPHETGQILSYPATSELLTAARQMTDASFMRLDLTALPIWYTDSSTESESIEWSSGAGQNVSVGSSSTHSYDESVSFSFNATLEEGGGSGSVSFNAGQSKSVSTLKTTQEMIGKSTGISINKPGMFLEPNEYQYAVGALVYGQQDPVGTYQNITQDVFENTHGILTVAFTADPTDAGSGSWWSSATPGNYLSEPDVALNHPARWDVTTPANSGAASTENTDCLPFGEDGIDCATFNEPNTGTLWTDEFYWMRGMFITPANSDGGPSIGSATAGDELRMQTRVYNYSLRDMPSGSTVHVRFYGQVWNNSPIAPKDASFLIDEIVLDPIPGFNTQELNWVLAETTWGTEPNASVPAYGCGPQGQKQTCGGQYLVFWVVAWIQDSAGNLVTEIPEHGLREIPAAVLAQITDVPIQPYSNNAGFYNSTFYVFPQASQPVAAALSQEGELVVESVMVSPDQALLNQKLELSALLHNGGTAATAVLVTFFDGDPEMGGKAFDVEQIPHIRAGDDFETRVPYRPRTCGVHTIFVKAVHGGSASTASAEVDVNCMSQTALLATNGISLGKGSKVVSGNVIDNATDGKITAGKNSTTAEGFGVIADRVNVKKGAELASNVTFNSLKNKGSITGKETEGVDLPVFANLPAFQTGAAGTEKIVVERNQSRELAAGNYGKIVVKKGGTLTLTGGTYNVRSIKAANKSALLFAGAADVRVAKNFRTGKNTFIGPSDGSTASAADIVLYVAGKKVRLGRHSVASASFYAPGGKVAFKGSEATGAFIGNKLKTGKESTLNLDSAFSD